MARLQERRVQNQGQECHPRRAVCRGYLVLTQVQAMAAHPAGQRGIQEAVERHPHPRWQHSQGHRGLHPRGREPRGGQGAG